MTKERGRLEPLFCAISLTKSPRMSTMKTGIHKYKKKLDTVVKIS